MQFWSKLLMCYTGINAKKSKPKAPKTKCKVLFNLNYYNLIIYNWNCCYNQKYTKVISTKLSSKCCQHNARYILYLWGVVLQCTWVLWCGVRCCMLRCTAHSHCNPCNVHKPNNQRSHQYNVVDINQHVLTYWASYIWCIFLGFYLFFLCTNTTGTPYVLLLGQIQPLLRYLVNYYLSLVSLS